MKSLFFLIFALGSLNLNAQLKDITKKIRANEGDLNAYLHEPPEKEKGEKPLIVVLHGCNQDAAEIAAGSGWNQLADYFGFYVLYPEQRASNNMFKCFNWFFDSDTEKDKGEMASIHEMVNFVQKNYSIDTNNVYVYGVSAGAITAVNYMAAYPSQIKSGAVLAGAAYKQLDSPSKAFSQMKAPKDTTETVLKERLFSQNPNYTGSFPTLIVIHGTNDKVVNFKNSEILVKQWKTAFDILSEKDTVVFKGDKVPSITKKEYLDAHNKSVISFYIAEDWGHYLMIDPGPIPKQGGEVGKHALDGDYFSTYEILKDWKLAK